MSYNFKSILESNNKRVNLIFYNKTRVREALIIMTCKQIKLASVLPTEPKGHSIRDQVANTLNTIHIMHTQCVRTSQLY
jgi:hypothetical protein